MQSDQKARTSEIDETKRLISSEKVEGTTVYNRRGDNRKRSVKGACREA